MTGSFACSAALPTATFGIVFDHKAVRANSEVVGISADVGRIGISCIQLLT